MSRKLLIVILIIALLIELGLTLGGLFARGQTLHIFQITMTPDASFLGFIVGWFSMFVTLICGLALWQVIYQKAGYETLCYLLGFWWIGIGIGIYIVFKRPDNLFMDSLKGLLIVAFTYGSKHRRLISS